MKEEGSGARERRILLLLLLLALLSFLSLSLCLALPGDRGGKKEKEEERERERDRGGGGDRERERMEGLLLPHLAFLPSFLLPSLPPPLSLSIIRTGDVLVGRFSLSGGHLWARYPPSRFMREPMHINI